MAWPLGVTEQDDLRGGDTPVGAENLIRVTRPGDIR